MSKASQYGFTKRRLYLSEMAFAFQTEHLHKHTGKGHYLAAHAELEARNARQVMCVHATHVEGVDSTCAQNLKGAPQYEFVCIRFASRLI